MKSLVLLVSVAFLSSCGLVFNGYRDKISVSCNEPEAHVCVNGVEVGKAPCDVKVKRTDEQIVEVRKQGFRSRRIYLETTPSAWIVGDVACLFVLFPVPLVVDMVCGTWKDVSPDAEYVHLVPFNYKEK